MPKCHNWMTKSQKQTQIVQGSCFERVMTHLTQMRRASWVFNAFVQKHKNCYNLKQPVIG